MKKIQCQTEVEVKPQNVRVRIIKAPLVDTKELKQIVYSRTKALVL